MLSSYYNLTKPGIIRGNLIAMSGGYFLAARGNVDFSLLVSTLLGLSLIIASACVFNNFIDRGIDKEMLRTNKRALVTGKITNKNALVFATILGIIGGSILIIFTNFLTFFTAFLGFLFYVVIYSYWKRRSIYGTLVGSISGAVPPVVGYLAVTNNFDIASFLLFAILVVWQMPHFYSIGTYRLKEYGNASIPILPVVKGISTTKSHIINYVVGFIFVSMLFTLFGYTGYIYLTIITLLGVIWLLIALNGYRTNDNDKWGRKMFSYSLLLLLIFCVLISVDFLLPF